MWNKVETKTSCEKPKLKPEIADTFSWAKEERQKLKEEVLIEDLRKKLIAKYPEQKCFFEISQIRVMQLWDNYDEQKQAIKEITNSNIFLLYSTDWKLLSYLNEEWKTIFDISNYNFDDDLANLLWKKFKTWYIRKNSKGQFELFDEKENKIFIQWEKVFNMFIYIYYLPKSFLR
jgi:hypothetical protein